jgi:hypothetical protein
VTDAPRRLLAFLIGTRCENYSRARAAAVLGSPATVDRALRVLIACDAITRQHGGRSTPSKIRVLIGLPEFLTRYRELTRYVAKTDALSGKTDALSAAYSLRNNYKERKPPMMEQRQTQNHRPLPEGVDEAELQAFIEENRKRFPVAWSKAVGA